MEAVRCLKRRISDAIYRQLVADHQRADLDQVLPLEAGPGGHCRGVSRIQRGQFTPALQHFGSATSRTCRTDATPDAASPKDRTRTTTRTHPLTTEGSRSAAPPEPRPFGRCAASPRQAPSGRNRAGLWDCRRTRAHRLLPVNLGGADRRRKHARRVNPMTGRHRGGECSSTTGRPLTASTGLSMSILSTWRTNHEPNRERRA